MNKEKKYFEEKHEKLDSHLLGKKIYSISSFDTRNINELQKSLLHYLDLCSSNNIELVTTRVNQSMLDVINMLESIGFYYVESSYNPYLEVTGKHFKGVYNIVPIQAHEVEQVGDAAKVIFKYGRYHQDSNIDNTLADDRYRYWLINAFRHSHQEIFLCKDDSEHNMGFFVFDTKDNKEFHLSLVGLMPEYLGKGVSVPVWESMLSAMSKQGCTKISTSISSHNLAVFNLYSKLGFKFPEPKVTLHKSFS